MKINDEVKQEIKIYQSNDYEIHEETTTYISMRKNASTFTGHIIVFMFFWWTLGLANVVYYFTNNKIKKVMK